MSASAAIVPIHSNGAALSAPAIDWLEVERIVNEVLWRNIPAEEREVLWAWAKRFDLNPLAQQVVSIQGRPFVTLAGLTHVAERSGKFDGCSVESSVVLRLVDDGKGGRREVEKYVATATVWHRDRSRPVIMQARQWEHENPKSTPWQKSPAAMTEKCALARAMRLSFSLTGITAAEEVGYDEVSDETNAGQVAVMGRGQAEWARANAREAAVEAAPPPAALPAPSAAPAAPQPPARPPLPPGKAETWDDDALLTVCSGEYPAAQVRRALTVYLNRARSRAELTERGNTAYQAGTEKALVSEIAKLVYAGLKEREPGAYQHHAREDAQPILGDTPDERLAMLARIREAIAASGKDEAAVNKYVYAVWKQPAIETLTAEESEELIATLEARGDEGEASAEAAAEVIAALSDEPAAYDDGEPQW